jgi:hypothetical protein
MLEATQFIATLSCTIFAGTSNGCRTGSPTEVPDQVWWTA